MIGVFVCCLVTEGTLPCKKLVTSRPSSGRMPLHLARKPGQDLNLRVDTFQEIPETLGAWRKGRRGNSAASLAQK